MDRDLINKFLDSNISYSGEAGGEFWIESGGKNKETAFFIRLPDE